ncbi:MAG TPA: FAD-dependent monooxygenase [Ktedonobacteraceae bacterium]|nr:FAD-dependent monooxygenase [Ktedonobacteraceae bacterium]
MVAQALSQLTASTIWHDPVIIVGANPIGLILALGLTYQRIPCVIIEEGEGTSQESNALALLDRYTLEILEAWGGSELTQHIASHGVVPVSERVLFRKAQLYRAPLTTYEAGEHYPRILNIHQSVLEQLLLHALQATRLCHVLWQHQVTEVAPHLESVGVTLVTTKGQYYLRAPYLFLTNGPPTPAHSAAGIADASHTHDQRFLNLDVLTTLGDTPERWFWFNAPFNSGRIAQVHPLPDGMAHVIYQLAPADDLAKVCQPDALQQRLAALLGDRAFEVVALSTYSYRYGVMPRFKQGRVLFLGSAARSLSLFGTSEVNSGAQDAWNLVWKLALVRAGVALETLLNTYDEERHAAALDAQRRTSDMMSFLWPPSGMAQWRRNTSLRLSQPLKFLRDSVKLGDKTDVSAYPASPLLSEDHRFYLGGRFMRQSAEQTAILKRFRAGPVVGMPAPALALPDADTGLPVALLQRCATGFVALCFTHDVEMALAVLRQVPVQVSGVPVSFLIITSSTPDLPAGDNIAIVLDGESKAAGIYNAGSRSLYLVRPDRIIAARRFDSDFNDIPALLRHSIGEDDVGSQTRIPRPTLPAS